VSADLEDLFTSLRNDPADLRLAPAATLRAIGERRTRVRRIGGAGALALALAAGTAGAAYSVNAADRPAPAGVAGAAPSHPPATIGQGTPPSTETLPSGPSSSGALSPSPSRTSPGSNSGGRVCGPADLVANTAVAKFNILVTISNISVTPCTVRGFPSLVYTQSNGSTAILPTTHRGPSNPTASLPHSGNATVNIIIDSGRPDTHVTDCTQAVTYHGVSMQLDTGQRVPLQNLSIDAQCDVVSITSWSQAAT